LASGIRSIDSEILVKSPGKEGVNTGFNVRDIDVGVRVLIEVGDIAGIFDSWHIHRFNLLL
jgi:hypothetical protein